MREASREYIQHHGQMSTMDYATLVSILANRESVDEAIRHNSPSKDSPDMSTAHASTFHTPTSVFEAEAPLHAEYGGNL